MDRRKLRVLLRHKSAMAGFALLILFVAAALSIGMWRPYDPTSLEGPAMAKPGARVTCADCIGTGKTAVGACDRCAATGKVPGPLHLLGTDDLGRDVLTRLCYGARVSLVIGFIAVAVSALIGVPLGAVSGYFGGWIDAAISRAVEVMLGLPTILLAILVATAMGKGVAALIVAVGVVGIPQFARQVRASVLSIKEQDFVVASRALGASPLRTLWHDVLPNALGPIIVLSTLGVGSAILTAAGLSFLGLGVETGTAEWGEMLHAGYTERRNSSHLALFSGLAITLAVLAINLFGDGLRDALDPKSEKKA